MFSSNLVAFALFLGAAIATPLSTRAPHLPTITSPANNTILVVYKDSGFPKPYYFQFPFLYNDGERGGEGFARAMLQNSSGMYQIGPDIRFYNSYDIEFILHGTLAEYPAGDYTFVVQEKTGSDWTTTAQTSLTLSD